MPKTIPAALLSVLQQEVPTVALLMEVARADGTVHRFTSHDADLVVPPASGQLYQASNAFSRSALENTSDLRTGDMEVIGFFDDAEISDADLEKGLLDGSRVTISVVDRDDPAKGTAVIFAGLFGEAKDHAEGHFVIELMDFKKLLKTVVGAKRQATCRADLGSAFDPDRPLESGCKFPVEPPVRADDTAYALGDFIRVATAAADPLVYGAGLINGGFDADGTGAKSSMTGWSISGGSMRFFNAHSGMNPVSGAVLMAGAASPGNQVEVAQDMDLRLRPEFDAANVDAGDVEVELEIWRGTADDTFGWEDRGRVQLWALDEDLAIITQLYDTGNEWIQPTDLWVKRSFSGSLPSGTRGLRVRCMSLTTTSTSNSDAVFDHCVIALTDNAQSAGGSSALYEARIYECTTAGTTAVGQPGYDTTLDATTSDGTAVFTARRAFSLAGRVAISAEDGRHFTVDLDALTGFAADWFDWGALTWEGGRNAGFVSQVKAATVPDFELLEQTPFAIEPGDSFRIAAGCNKTRAHCRDKFRIAGSRDFALGNAFNFRGEVDLPGRDAVFRTPDAR